MKNQNLDGLSVLVGILIGFIIGFFTFQCINQFNDSQPTFPLPSKAVFQKIDGLSWDNPDVWEYVNELQKFIEVYDDNK